jgi:hypothetical protein
MTYKGTVHKILFTRFICSGVNSELDNAALSAAYLLSSDLKLWRIMKSQFENGEIDFSIINIKEITIGEYVLFRAAQDLYERTNHLNLCDLADRSIVSDITASLIKVAVMICRYGISVIEY